jgi:predicted RNA-binding protein YlxR (DUF448 family)
MTKLGHIPARRCVVCRRRRSKDELIRLVYTEGRGVVVDVGQRMPGRGAYLCGDDRCLRRSLDTKVMSSAFGKRVVIDENVRKSIESISRRGWERSKRIR